MPELSSTYVVQDRKKKKDELTRLTIQDQMLTAGMGGVLAEQADPTVFRHVLDIGCGTGGWLIKAAQTYPTMEKLVGIDISQQMIKYARKQAASSHANDRVEFHIMDALKSSDFPGAPFDLVNLRFGVSFLRTWDWPRMLGGVLRATRPGGIVRITEWEQVPQSNSSALISLYDMATCAFYRAGYFFEQQSTGLIDQLQRLLHQYGCQAIQTQAYLINYQAGTKEGEAFYENMRLVLQTLHPFVERWGCAAQNYNVIYRRALEEMNQPGFYAKWNLVTIRASKA